MTVAVQQFTPSAPVNWDQEIRGAAALLKSGLCPPALKSPEAVLFVIMAGRDLGLSPVASLRGLSVIQGKVEVSADLQLGLFHKHGGRSRWVTLTVEAAELELSAPWMTAPHVSRFTMADAQRAKIASENYNKYPKAMLRSRAITQGLKDIGFDATAGVYAPGEIGGEAVVTEAGEVQTPAAVVDELNTAPTSDQLALLERVLKSSVWNEDERAGIQVRAEKASKADMSELLDELLEEGRQRKAARAKSAPATVAD